MSSSALFRRATAWGLALAVVISPALAQTAPGTRARPKTDRAVDREKSGSAKVPEAGTAKAESPQAVASKPAGTEAPPSIFGDTKKFSRYGGWGSMGGTLSQFGMSRTALITMPPVQEELKLTETQKKDVRTWLDAVRKHGEDMGKALRPPEGQGGESQAQGNVPMAARILQFATFLNQVGEMLHERENGLAEILKPAQRKRLDQIALQMEGVAAVARPEVAERINVGPDQQELIQQILTQSRGSQMTAWIEQGRAMARLGRDRPPPPAARGDGPEQDPAAEQEPVPGQPPRPPADPKARAELQKAFRHQFESMRSQTDRIQDQTTQAILKVLTKKQRASFDRLLGPPFDASKVNAITRPPGGGNPPAPAGSNGR